MNVAEAVERLRVVRCERLTPRMRRLTLACANCADYRSGPLHLRLLVPGDAGPVPRYYSIRCVDVARGEITLDALLHQPAGPGSSWAAGACVGDVIASVGPIGRPIPESGRLVLIGDETAVPFIARIIEEASPERRIDAVIEVADAREEQAIARGPNVQLTWIHRDQKGPSGLPEAAAGLVWHNRGEVFVYAGVEAATAHALRALASSRSTQPAVCQRIVTFWTRMSGPIAA